MRARHFLDLGLMAAALLLLAAKFGPPSRPAEPACGRCALFAEEPAWPSEADDPPQ